MKVGTYFLENHQREKKTNRERAREEQVVPGENNRAQNNHAIFSVTHTQIHELSGRNVVIVMYPRTEQITLAIKFIKCFP